ncbi:MAG: AI-2E family transporter [Alphaproteobacteria bacterium]|nr:AI-2E family transporter [Alphaproteobacteria bacterium]
MSNVQKLWIWGIAFVIFFVGVYILRDVLLPFVAGMIIAYFLDPATTKLQQKLHSRTAALCVVFAVLIFVLLLCIFIIVPVVQKQLSIFLSNLPVYVGLLWSKAEPYVIELKRLFPHQADSFQQTVSEHLSGGIKLLLGTIQKLLSGSMAFINLLSLLLITPVVAFYLLRDWNKFCSVIKGLLPREEARTIRRLLSEMNDIISGFVRGQATVCLCLGIFYAVGLTLSGLDLGLLIGLGIGVLSFIPYVGSTIGFVTSVGLAFVQFDDWKHICAVVVVFFLGQMLEGNVLTPKLVGEKVGLHPVWVMFALLAGATLFGFLGVLIAVPTAAIIGVLVRFGIQKYKESTLYLGAAKPHEDA